MTPLHTVLLASAVLAADPKPAVKPLEPGDSAPPLAVAKWTQGDPIKAFQPGQTYVVEFWATWCGPCRQTIPHLSELAEKFDGKATVIGVSVWERGEPDEVAEMVEKFVKQMGKKMTYRVAIDDDDKMGNAWMKAAQEGGIPTAFIVDKAGKIAWIGHPLNGLDKVLQEVIDGKFDTKAFALARKKEREEEAEMERLLGPVAELAQANKPKEAVAALDKVVADHPKYKDMTAIFRFRMLMAYDVPAAAEFATALAGSTYKDNVRALDAMSAVLLAGKPSAEAAKAAAAIGEQALKLDKEPNPARLTRLAAAHAKAGDSAKAVARQAEAVALLEKADASEKAIAAAKEQLEEYRKK